MTKILRKVNTGVVNAFCALLVLVSFASLSPEALAQTYPTKPIRIVIAGAAGSAPDIMARLIGPKLAEAFGQPIIVDDREGASGRIGVEVAARAAPDGYTLLMVAAIIVINAAMYEDLKYNLVKDFSPISLLGTAPSVLVVNPSVPVTSVKELVTLAKSRPGALKYGAFGFGSFAHLAAEMFKFMTGTDILHVPYKSGPASFTGTMVGEVDMTFSTIISSLQVIRSGKLRALGVTSAKRSTLVPDLPAISETVPGFELMQISGLVAPAKTPPAILSKLNTEVNKALNASGVREQMIALGVEPRGSSQKDFALIISEEVKKIKEAIRRSGLKPEG